MGKKYIIITSLLACLLLYFIEQVLLTNYLVKTLAKILLFTLIPWIYIKFFKQGKVNKAVNSKKINKQHLKLGIIFGVISFLIILTAYYLLKGQIDLDGILGEMQNKSKITAENFILVGAYVTLGNSFLEEFFFRGFIFLNLYEEKDIKIAYIYSSVLFGLYHMAIFKNWFNPWLIALALIGLVSIGFIFDWLDTKSQNFINSWLVHIFADSAIILIGLRMFGMI